MTMLGLTRPVAENVVTWYDHTRMFSADDIGLEIRVWVDRSDNDVSFRVHKALVDVGILNYVDPGLWPCEVEPCDDPLELAREVATTLKANSGLQINAVEVTIRGQGSKYYPEWP